MNLAIRKLAMLEKNIAQKEEESRLDGYSTNIVDQEFKNRITTLMNKIRSI